MRRGRPLRFLAVVLGGWTAARVVLLWPEAQLAAERTRAVLRADAVPAAVRRPEASVVPARSLSASARASGRSGQPPERGVRAGSPAGSALPSLPAQRDAPPETAAMEASTPVPFVGADRLQAVAVEPGDAGPTRHDPSRLAGSTWFVARPNGGQNLAFGQLGASQAGARLTYALGEARRVALSGRLSAPLSGRGREGAVGVDWQPTALPVHLLVEERVPLDGGPARPAAQAIAGVARRLPLGLQLEAYGQAGVVHRRGGFADGAARIARPLFASRVATVDLGAGAWGAAQRGVSRVDLGPTIGATVPMRGGAVRLSVDYRVRVTGRARPGSGLAVTLGSSF